MDTHSSTKQTISDITHTTKDATKDGAKNAINLFSEAAENTAKKTDDILSGVYHGISNDNAESHKGIDESDIVHVLADSAKIKAENTKEVVKHKLSS